MGRIRRRKHHGAHPQALWDASAGASIWGPSGAASAVLVLHWGISVVVRPLRGAASAVARPLC